MIQLVTVAAAFLITLFMVLGGIANIQDNLGEYRRQLDAEGFEGVSVGFINQKVILEGGLLTFLRKHCALDSDSTSFNPRVSKDCFGDSGFKTIFGVDRKVETNELRKVQSLEKINGDSSEIQFTIHLMKPGSNLWEFIPVTKDEYLFSVSYIEVEAVVFVKEKGSPTEVFRFKKAFRP